MSEVRLTVHRATNQIGGNCIEIATGDHRILLDVGRPLDAPNDATGLLPATLDPKAPMDGVLISHPHQDHYGLLEETPRDWLVFCGEATKRLIQLTSGIFGKPIDRDFRPWKSGSPFEVGPFRITPYLTDHSAFDTHMLLIETVGKRLLYSGDFRTHGRKFALVERFMAAPPSDIDVLLMEGTNLGSDKPCVTESDLETNFEALFRQAKDRVFVTWSAQNIDRTVTLYRACLKARRTLVVDLYTAEVLELLGDFGRLPRPDFAGIKVVVTSAMARMYRRKGNEAFVERMVPFGISAKKLSATHEKWVVMVRPSLIRDWELCLGSQALMYSRYREPKLPQMPIEHAQFVSNYLRLFRSASANDAETLWSLFEACTMMEHGAMLVVLEDAEAEAERLRDQGTPIEPAQMTRDLLNRVSDIDGSILLDPAGRCFAVGVILDGIATEECSPARGSRYNSALRYVGGSPAARMAIIVSDDRTVDLVPLLLPQILKREIEARIQSFEKASTEDYHADQNWLDKRRFYLKETETRRINAVLDRLNEAPKDVGEIRYLVSRFVPSSEVDDSYFL